MIGEGLVDELALYLYRERSRLRLLQSRVLRRTRLMRVAFSALLRVENGGRYVLVRNLHRPETFGPFGGVFKYYPEARPELDVCEFSPQVVGPGDDMIYDLRGFLPECRAAKLHRWYINGTNREQAADCLRRELREEIREINLMSKVKVPRDLRLQPVRTIMEGPEWVPGHDYRQLRIFEVYDLISHNSATKSLLKHLIKFAAHHKDLVMADPQEIRGGRCKDGKPLGHHCGYLLWGKRVRPDTPAFAYESPPTQTTGAPGAHRE